MILHIFTLIALACIQVDAGIIDTKNLDGHKLKDSFKEIDAQLIREVSSNDVRSNFKVAKDLLEHSSGSTDDIYSAYQLFVALMELDGQDRCDSTAISIIRQNELASCQTTADDSKILDKSQCLGRVGKILLDIAEKSTRKCPKIYADLMRQKLNQFNPDLFIIVEDLTEHSIYIYMKRLNNEDGSNEANNLVELALNTDSIMQRTLENGIWFYCDLQATIKTYVDRSLAEYLKPIEDERTGKFSLNEEMFKELFEKHGMKPCRDYVEFFGEDVFEPATYLAKFQLIDSREIDEQYYKNWIRYNMCKGFTRNKQKLLVESMEEAEYHQPSTFESSIVNIRGIYER